MLQVRSPHEIKEEHEILTMQDALDQITEVSMFYNNGQVSPVKQWEWFHIFMLHSIAYTYNNSI